MKRDLLADMRPQGAPTAQDLAKDPTLRRHVEAILAYLRQDMIPFETQLQIVNSMTPSARREIVSKVAGLEASLLMTVKQQVKLVDSVLRRIVNDDGSLRVDAENYEIPLKDAMNLALKVTQVITREMPKVYTLDRVQRQEEALRRVMEKHMTREQQEALLEELEKIEHGES